MGFTSKPLNTPWVYDFPIYNLVILLIVYVSKVIIVIIFHFKSCLLTSAYAKLLKLHWLEYLVSVVTGIGLYNTV